VEARCGEGAKEAQQWTEGSETGAEKIGINWMEEVRDEEKRRGHRV
jgi:hypothetical protein